MFNPSESAAALRKAMQGWGTDDDTLINTITSLSNMQLQQVRQSYATEIGRDLIDDLKSETSGNYEWVITGLIYTPAEFDAVQLNKAVKGVGTAEEVFVQTLCHRTTNEVMAIEEAYYQLFGRTLKSDIEDDFSGDAQKVALGLIGYMRESSAAINQAEVDEWVEALYNAGEGKMGTDETMFVEAICGSGPQWLKAVNEAYGRKHGHTLVSAVEKEFSGFAAEALKALLQEHDQYYASLIEKACAGGGTDDELLTRVLLARRNRLKDINNKFMALYSRSIASTIESEVTGDYGKIIKAIANAA